ncbi:hypothetical protein PAXRUDRAFT_826084 [Paxillus rubicundulus Ve08.2h10]|uniref:Uncharacterized protein n=1 Tax=Paxillus rubicundulus Ve08.2h10 TaxID=930991 RepID=A0A0D0DF95_9AGAM|nr:hypothetical protein PAXRUDRAFT_826084 [Paxillus rubicundulus Ve08.2h10]
MAVKLPSPTMMYYSLAPPARVDANIPENIWGNSALAVLWSKFARFKLGWHGGLVIVAVSLG